MAVPKNPTSIRLPFRIRQTLAEMAQREHRSWQQQLIFVLAGALPRDRGVR
jgi:hypothetical protein